MAKICVLGPVHIECDRGLQPLETRLIVALALATDAPQSGDQDDEVRLGGLDDAALARVVWNNGNLSRNVQRTINHIHTTTSIRITREGRRRYLTWTADRLDYNIFRRMLATARELEDTRASFDAMNETLGLVRGVPLDGLGTEMRGWLQKKRKEISAEIADATVEWLRTAILLNEKWTVLERAAQIQKWLPRDENICRYVMYLLYRAGRRARALECRDITLAANKGVVSKSVTELSRIIEEHGDVVLATESLNLRVPSSGEPFRTRFSFAEVGEFLMRMLGEDGGRQMITTTQNNAKPMGKWKPDLIVGINRGGAIVGGMICRRFDYCRVLPILILWKTDESGHNELYVASLPPREANHPSDDADTVKRILLTDEAFRTGAHVKLARKELEKTFPNAEIHVATLISVRQDVSYCGMGPGRGEVGGPTYYGQLVHSRNFELPWDPISPRT